MQNIACLFPFLCVDRDRPNKLRYSRNRYYYTISKIITRSAFTCSKLTIKAIEPDVEYVQS